MRRRLWKLGFDHPENPTYHIHHIRCSVEENDIEELRRVVANAEQGELIQVRHCPGAE
jgi:hypothetical protein